MSAIRDITETEQWIVRTTLKERYGRDVELQYGDAEIRLDPADRELTSCPVVVWEVGGCHFVVMKTGEKRYRCQFYYRGHQQYGTGIDEYDDLSECTVSLLQVQADHSARQRGAFDDG